MFSDIRNCLLVIYTIYMYCTLVTCAIYIVHYISVIYNVLYMHITEHIEHRFD